MRIAELIEERQRELMEEEQMETDKDTFTDVGNLIESSSPYTKHLKILHENVSEPVIKSEDMCVDKMNCY
jgi:acyl-CoA reductase-like NAD-dependent aldehyde dehydrogenase